MCPCSKCRLCNKKKRGKNLSARNFFKLFLHSNEGSTVTVMTAILQAIKQSSPSCDELEENNDLKEDSKCGILSVLLSVSDFRSLIWSCYFSKITLDGWKHPTLCSFFALVALPQSGSVNISSRELPHKGTLWQQLVVSRGMGCKFVTLAQPGWNSVVPCCNVSINGYSPVTSHGGVFLLGLPILLSEICSQLVAFQWVAAAPNPAPTVWAVSYWGQWESST